MIALAPRRTRGYDPTAYCAFINRKSQTAGPRGFAPLWLPDWLYDFQAHLVNWSVRKGRASIMADCGLGKTPMLLVWAQNMIRHTNRPALVVAPLAVVAQIVREAAKFGVEARQSRDGTVHKNITVTNYERLHHFDPGAFSAVVYDEAQALKAFDGKRRKQATRFVSKTPYRLLCSATPAPNDYVELGTASEALGELTQSEMLSHFFHASDKKRHSLWREGDFWNRPKWFFKTHAEQSFWRWVCSWGRALRSPADLGFDGSRFVLPPLSVTQHVVGEESCFPGELAPRVARTLAEQRVERKRTLRQRCEKVAELVAHGKQALVWCQYNDEGDLLERLIPGAVQVAGCDSDEAKEEHFGAFQAGQLRVLVTKPKIGAWGLNLQNCGHHTFFPSHSFEQWYQAVRRSWRFGRTEPVQVDVVTTPGERGVTENLGKKQRQSDHLFATVVREMNHHAGLHVADRHVTPLESPSWL